jgi:hypothetical protein
MKPARLTVTRTARLTAMGSAQCSPPPAGLLGSRGSPLGRRGLGSGARSHRWSGRCGRGAGAGRTSGRHRLGRSGERAANGALYIVTIVRMRHHQPTRDCVERRTAEGLSKREIIRCLKRYIAREIYANLPRPETANPVIATPPAAAA